MPAAFYGGVVKLADTDGSNPFAEMRLGSNPSVATIFLKGMIKDEG